MICEQVEAHPLISHLGSSYSVARFLTSISNFLSLLSRTLQILGTLVRMIFLTRQYAKMNLKDWKVVTVGVTHYNNTSSSF
jgi:hypothetical protein